MKNNINDSLFQKIRELKLPINSYALFGSAPIGIRGLKKCGDIDIIMIDDIWSKYKDKTNWELKKMSHGNMSEYLENGDIQIWKDWYPGEWNIQELVNKAEIIDNLPFVKLEYVLKWKKMNGREKDLKDIEILEKFLQ